MKTSLLEACRKVRIKMLWQWRLHEQVFELNQTLLSIAIEACNFVRCLFTVRVLDETDILLNSIQTRDLEPPRQRPETSARTAGRLIAQAMGMKLPSTSFGSRELKKQEEARKQRIVARKNWKDDAWGSDDGVN
ncbi:hypothetical protein CK203_106676 [Vitis vinifera]|uniref:Uncharacterized protein n=1 Tax=Vitis vinifera TaxID=29760 RepID=A0A438D8G4_VITVI|nr:hypothetical protein CK203_106676 [Vitis vinifera]